MKIEILNARINEYGTQWIFKVRVSHKTWTTELQTEISVKSVLEAQDPKVYILSELTKSVCTYYREQVHEDSVSQIVHSLEGKEIPEEFILGEKLDEN